MNSVLTPTRASHSHLRRRELGAVVAADVGRHAATDEQVAQAPARPRS
ncbi:hypothetical protein PLANPX_3018 [Lacipirellula parvula]|uniref:Uncharacterized protein n=1 Tax=Lacipirellula parvula TaxID=2650471 RepID=A0A5K7XGJ1_9BACT|nr:hypothetical protein PLANPX_3018 [Lacipirellula parvula]